jgi:hypothetical protein
VAKLAINHVDDAPVVEFPAIAGVRGQGQITSRAVFATPERPLFLWRHELAGGAELSLERPPFGHVFYVFGGALELEDRRLEEGGVVLAEHLSRTRMRAAPGGAVVMHFHRPDSYPQPPKGAGGHVHVVGKEGLLRTGMLPDTSLEEEQGYSGILWAELDCPTCELWLHRSDSARGRPQDGTLHTHSADEIIFMLRGELFTGNRRLTAGSGLAIDGHTRYRVGAGEAGFAFLNFRAEKSELVMLEQGDETPRDESELWLSAQVV